jgi:hypothetical protein
MCQDAITCHLNAQHTALDRGLDAEETKAWECASQKMTTAASQCFHRIGTIEPHGAGCELREFSAVRDCELPAVHESELAELLHRCSLTTSVEEQAALDRIVVLSCQRILLDDSADPLKQRGADWQRLHEATMSLLQRVLIKSHETPGA